MIPHVAPQCPFQCVGPLFVGAAFQTVKPTSGNAELHFPASVFFQLGFLPRKYVHSAVFPHNPKRNGGNDNLALCRQNQMAADIDNGRSIILLKDLPVGRSVIDDDAYHGADTPFPGIIAPGMPAFHKKSAIFWKISSCFGDFLTAQIRRWVFR